MPAPVIAEVRYLLFKYAGTAGEVAFLRTLAAGDFDVDRPKCQQLKAAGAGSVFVALEGAGNARFARSCSSLGYQPSMATSSRALNADASQDPNVRKLGVFLAGANAPYLALDTAGGKLFQATYDAFAPGSPLDQNSLAGLRLGQAVRKGDRTRCRPGPPSPITRELLFEGLWQIKGETLDGLAPRITFNKGGPRARNDCYGLLNLTTAGFSAANGSKFGCFTGVPQGF